MGRTPQRGGISSNFREMDGGRAEIRRQRLFSVDRTGAPDWTSEARQGHAPRLDNDGAKRKADRPFLDSLVGPIPNRTGLQPAARATLTSGSRFLLSERAACPRASLQGPHFKGPHLKGPHFKGPSFPAGSQLPFRSPSSTPRAAHQGPAAPRDHRNRGRLCGGPAACDRFPPSTRARRPGPSRPRFHLHQDHRTKADR